MSGKAAHRPRRREWITPVPVTQRAIRFNPGALNQLSEHSGGDKGRGRVTIFLGCGFAAKYREGGGNFSVPLQWMLGLKRLRRDAIWLELLPSSENEKEDRRNAEAFQRHLREHGLAGHYCLILQKPKADEHDVEQMEFFGMSKRAFLDRLAGPNVLLNLSYSIHPPLLLQFERRIFCDLDPSEIFYW